MFIHMLDKGTWKLFWSCYAEKKYYKLHITFKK